MKNKKRIIILILLLLIAAGITVFAVNAYDNYKKEMAYKAKAQKAEITEVFHDQAGEFVSTIAPGKNDKLTLKLRCSKYNLTKAQIQYTLDKGTTWTCIDMAEAGKDDTGYYSYWKGTIPAQTEPYFYRFAVANETQSTQYYGVEGLKSYQLDTDEMFYVIPGFNTPEWSQGTLWYYVITGQFNNGDTSNDIAREELMQDMPYGNEVASMTRNSGDLQGIKDKLDYLQSLGVKTVSIGPYFSSQQMFGYGIDNMGSVETAYGNETEMKELIDEIHSRGMKVTTDMLISYTATASKYLNEWGAFPMDGAYQDKNSDYFSLFKFPKWPYNYTKIWGQIGLNYDNDTAKDLIYRNADSMVLKYLNEPYGIDGYRFDAEESVGNLGYGYDPTETFTGIREAMKSISEDKLLLSENPEGIGDQYNTMFDSSWQKNGYFAMRGWLDATYTGSDMIKVLQDNLVNTVRPRALSSFNFLGQHDVTRAFSDTEGQKNSIQSLLLLQMTYLGSPVIYFGDEIGMTNGAWNSQVAQAFNWDESQWNYKIHNLYKTLGNLRDKYTCLQNGVLCQGEIDDSEMFLAFGRYDDDGAVITLCNKQNENLQEEIVVSRYNICDGEILTDYLTGRTYEVKNGKIMVDIIPGGTLLVTGDETSEYREDYAITEAGAKIDILQTEQNVFKITGDGSIDGSKDKLGLLNKKIFNNASVMTTMNGEAHGAIMLRETTDRDSAVYAAEYDNGSLTVKVRATKGEKIKEVAKVDIPKGAAIKIVRGDGNTFTTMYREGEADAEGAWTTIDESVTKVEMPEQIYMALASLKDKTEFSDTAVEVGDQQLYDDFDGQLGSMLTASGEKVNIQDGKLKLASTDKVAKVVANAHTSDWTFKAELSSVKLNGDNSFAGIMSEANDNERLVLARTKADGENILAIARYVDGKWQIAGSTKDTKPNSKVTLQLQRIGSQYTAVASYDGKKWFNICDGVYCNLTRMYAGAFTYNAEADFEYVCFGDSINDKVTSNTPMTLNKLNISAKDEIATREIDMMTFLGAENTWKDIGAGYGKSTTNDLALMYLKNRRFNNVKAEATIKIKDGKGTAGILIGKENYSEDTDKCYKIGFNKNGKLFIAKDNKELATATVKQGTDGLRLVVRRENGYINVLTGEKGLPILSVKDETYGKGYIAYYADKVAVDIINYDITTLEVPVYCTSNLFGTDEKLEVIEANTFVHIEKAGITNGIVTFDANTIIPEVTNADGTKTEEDMKKERLESANQIGVAIGNSYGRNTIFGGMLITYNCVTGELSASEFGEEVAKKKVTEADVYTGAHFKIVVNNGKYQIYLNDSAKPVMTVESQSKNGGAIAFYSSKQTTSFTNIVIEDTTNANSYKNEQSTAKGQGFAADFTEYIDWTENFYRVKADGARWQVEDGVLKGHSISRTWNIANISNGEYKDVEVSFKFKYSDDYEPKGGFKVGIGKQVMYGDCAASQIYMYMDCSTGMTLLQEIPTGQLLNGWNTYLAKLQEWHTFKIRIQNNEVTFWVDGEEVSKTKVTSYTGGYIAFQNDSSEVELDDVKIIPLS